MLITGTDGVGTKLKIAYVISKHDTISLDAMNVNNLVVDGAEPFYLIDFFSCESLDADLAVEVFNGIYTGCRMAKYALVGEETTEMANVYSINEYELVGSTTGAMPRGKNRIPDRE